MSSSITRFDHQIETTQFILDNPFTFITTDAGCGKTLSVLDSLKHREGRVLILAPKSILEPSWGQDIKKFTPELSYRIANPPNATREAAFTSNAKIVLLNHDGIKYVAKNLHLLEGFSTLVADEATAFKSGTSQRTKACLKVAELMQYRILMSGTVMPNGPMDLHSQMMILDGGERLGNSFWKFRSATHSPISKGAFTEWCPKEGVTEALFGLIQDINIRHKLEECLSIPANFVTEVDFDLAPRHQKAYDELRVESVLAVGNGEVTAMNAAVLATKLMQASAGSIYDSSGDPQLLSTERYELILDLIEAREHCVVAFNWRHQRDELVKLAKKRKLTYGIIDGSVSAEKRTEAVTDFQAGKLRIIFAHPQAAAHGLTLTKGTTTIWTSPTYNLEHYAQFCRRIYRAGQTRTTETIHITASNTLEAKAYKRLAEKKNDMDTLLDLLEI